MPLLLKPISRVPIARGMVDMTTLYSIMFRRNTGITKTNHAFLKWIYAPQDEMHGKKAPGLVWFTVRTKRPNDVTNLALLKWIYAPPDGMHSKKNSGLGLVHREDMRG